MAIETEHRGFKITYGENSERWECYALELDAPKLSALKSKINAFIKARVQAEDLNIMCGYRTYRGIDQVYIIGLSEPGKDGVEKVWVTPVEKGNKGFTTRERFQVKIDTLVEWTEEVEAAISKAKALQKQASALSSEADRTIKEAGGDQTNFLSSLMTSITKIRTAE